MKAALSYRFLLPITLLGIFFLHQGCTPEHQYKVLSFFFDGVKDPNQKPDTNKVVVQFDSATLNLNNQVFASKPEIYFHKPFEQGRNWKIKARGVEMYFRWFMNEIPKEVQQGKRYTIVGDFLTANQGAKFILDDCVVIPRHNELMDKFNHLIHNSVININEYIEKPNKDTFFVKEK